MANAVDHELAVKLKSDLEFDVQRRNAFIKHSQNKNIYESEREKGLSLYLEEQEKWDVNREKGMKQQRSDRLRNHEVDEQSPEYARDQKEKQKYELDQENARKKHVETKKEVTQYFDNKVTVSESEELDIYNDRPRFELRSRGQNKWAKKGSGSGSGSPAWGGGSGSSSGGGESSGTAPFDYPVSGGGDYVPTDNYDDLPPPPPLVPYDSYGNGQNGGVPPPYYGEGNPDFAAPVPGQSYPPAPPDGGWDF